MESADRVTLFAVDKTVALVYCARDQSLVPLMPGVTLRAPLGSRSIVDGLTGRRIPAFEESRALRPAATPDGWTNESQSPYGTEVTTVSEFGGPDAATLGEVFFDGSWADRGPQQLWIVQTTGTWHPPATVVTTPVTVRGHPGRAAPGIIVWPENGLTMAVRWDTDPYRIPRTDQLVAIAATLVPGEGR
jgi:hypothetical protein